MRYFQHNIKNWILVHLLELELYKYNLSFAFPPWICKVRNVHKIHLSNFFLSWENISLFNYACNFHKRSSPSNSTHMIVIRYLPTTSIILWQPCTRCTCDSKSGFLIRISLIRILMLPKSRQSKMSPKPLQSGCGSFVLPCILTPVSHEVQIQS